MKEKAKSKPLLSDDLKDQFIFLDEFGICRFEDITIWRIRLQEDERTGPFYIPSKDNNGEIERISDGLTAATAAQIQSMLKKGVYVSKKNRPGNDVYYVNGVVGPTQAKKNFDVVKVASLQLRIRLYRYREFDENGPRTAEFLNVDLTLTKAEEITERKCIPLGPKVHPTQVDIERLRTGDEIFLPWQGKVLVTKLYGFPENKDHFCQVRFPNGDVTDFPAEGIGSLYYLPYEEHPDEFAELDENKNELMLLPILAKDRTHGIHTYCWKEVPDAARYVVKLYAIKTAYGKKRLYRLSDIDLDRNTRYLTLPPIAGAFACKVIAEDREGNPIAITRASRGANE